MVEETTKGGQCLKKIIALIVLSIFPTLFLYSQPKLSINTTELNLGKITSGEIAKGKIILKNIGNEELVINSIQPSCGCTTVKQPKHILAPNEEDVAEIEFNSAGYYGQVTKFVNISTNDPSAQNTTIKLLIDIEEILVPESRINWLGEIALDDSVTKTITLTNTSEKPILIKNVLTSAPNVSVKWEKTTIPPQKQYSLQVTVKPVQRGFRNEYLWLETNNPTQPRYEVKISFIGKQNEQ